MESNHHGCFHPQGPQPCASTNSATAAGRKDSRDSAPGCPRRVAGVRRKGYSANKCSSVKALGNWRKTEPTMVDLDLTKRQKEIFDFIRKYAAKSGYPPTGREIGKAVGLASSSTVHAHLANLEKLGLLRRDPSKPRAIELLDRAMGSAVETMRGIVGSDSMPLLGSVAAGQPMLAEENIEDYVSV